LANVFTKIGKAIDVFKSTTAVSMPLPQINNVNTFVYGDNLINFFNFSDNSKITKALRECPPIVYIPSKISDAICKGMLKVVDSRTYEDAKGYEDYLQLLKRPNYSQTQDQFITQIVMTAMNYGYCVILKVIPLGFNEIANLWALPFEKLQITWKTNSLYNALFSNDVVDLIDSIYFDGKLLNKEDIFIIPDKNYYNTSMVIPESRLRSYEDTIFNLTINLKARGKMMNSPMGLISLGGDDNIHSIGIKKDEQLRLQNEFTDGYGFKEGQSKVWVANTAVDYKQMGYPIGDMLFKELSEDDINSLSEIYRYPSRLLGQTGNTNVSELKEANAQLYNECVMPYADHIMQVLSENLIGEDNILYWYDYSEIGALQADNKEESETRARDVVSLSLGLQNGLYTYGEVCAILNKEPNEQWKDKYFHELPPELIATFRLSNTGIENPASVNQNQNQNDNGNATN